MLPSDIYGQPEAPNPVLDEATVLNLARGHTPRRSAVESSTSETGISVIRDSIGVS